MTQAKMADWQNHPLPPMRAELTVDRLYSMTEIRAIQAGIVPEVMEDKWFIYWQDNKLYFHRSWTGVCIYVVTFREVHGGFRMVKALANRDPDQYRFQSDAHDCESIIQLVDVLLLRRPVQGLTSANSADSILAQWAQFGRAVLGKHSYAE